MRATADVVAWLIIYRIMVIISTVSYRNTLQKFEPCNKARL
ncbi:hypothetical protein [Rickettsia endosymbiont of Aspidapion aeneum]